MSVIFPLIDTSTRADTIRPHQLLYTAETVAAYVVGAYWDGLANNNMTDEQRAALSPDSEEWRLRVGGSKTQLLGWLVYTVLLWTLKFSWIIYYSRLTYGTMELTWC